MSELENLMRDVARTVQTDVRRRQLLPEIQARMAALDEKQQRRPARAVWGWSMAGVAACAAGIAFYVMKLQPVSFAVDGATSAGSTGAVGQKLAAPEASALSLRFSDGSQVTLPPRAQAHVDDVDNQGATVAVDEGTVEVSVVHRAKTRWQVRAGRYQIHVTGTRFAAGWDSRQQTLTVTMREGSVIVTGPGLKQGTPLTTGQRLRVNAAAEPAAAIDDASAPVPAAPTQAEAAPAEAADADAEPAVVVTETPAAAREERRIGGSRTRRAAPTKLAQLDNDWRAFESRHQYKEALDAAVSAGWDNYCARLGADDLVRLGNAARFAKDVAHAESAYLAARRRFPSADQPVYFLGRLAFDGRRDYAAAARWFDIYVKRFPGGPVVVEAAGLLLDSRLKAGDNVGARDAAGSYLRLFPHGPHAGKARATVGP